MKGRSTKVKCHNNVKYEIAVFHIKHSEPSEFL